MKNYKRVLSAILAALLVFSMAGCGKNNGSNGKKGKKGGALSDSKISDAKDTSTDDVFQEDPDFTAGDVKGWINNLVIRGDRLFFYSDEWIEDSSSSDAEPEEATDGEAYIDGEWNGYDMIRFYSMPLTGGEPELLAEVKSDDNYYLDRLFVDKSENIYVTMTKWTSDDRSVSKLYRLDNGKLADERDISAITDVSGDSWLSNLYMNEDYF